MRCSHVTARNLYFGGLIIRHCPRCLATLPLGPANDRGVPVREMELAEAIARTWTDELADSMAAYHVEQDAYDRLRQAQRTRRRGR